MPKPVYALVGADSFLQLQKLDEIRAQFRGEVQTAEFDGETAQLADVLDELRSFAMFAAAKLVVVRNADEFISRFREQLEPYLAKPCDTGTLVLRANSLPKNQRVYKLIEKSGQIEFCVPPKSEREISQWIVGRARIHKLTIDSAAAFLLADLIGNDLGRLDSELAKLALQNPGGKVTLDSISGSVAFQREQEMWHMTDELSAGRPAEAIRRWRFLVQLDPSSEFRAVTWLTMWLEKMSKATAMVRSGSRPFDIARELKIWPAQQVDSLLSTAAKMGDAGIRRAVDLLAETDRRTKNGGGDAVTNVEQFILSLAAK